MVRGRMVVMVKRRESMVVMVRVMVVVRRESMVVVVEVLRVRRMGSMLERRWWRRR